MSGQQNPFFALLLAKLKKLCRKDVSLRRDSSCLSPVERGTSGPQERRLELIRNYEQLFWHQGRSFFEKTNTDSSVYRLDVPGLSFTMMESDCMRIRAFVVGRSCEISLLFLVNRQGNVFHLHTPIIPYQFGHHSRTVIDESRLFECFQNYSSEERARVMVSAKGYLHSHMRHSSCMWSKQWDELICDQMRNRDYRVFVVVSEETDDFLYRARLDLYEPVRLTIDDIPIRIIPDVYDREAIRKEMDMIFFERVFDLMGRPDILDESLLRLGL